MNRSGLPARFGRNTTSNYVRLIASMAVALVTTPVLARGLGKEQYGIWALAGSMIVYLELLELGFGDATVRQVAHLRARHDEAGVRRAVATAVWLLAIPGALALFVGIVVAVLAPSLFHLPPSLVTPMRVLLLLLALDLAASIPGDTMGGTLIALQRFELLNLTVTSVLVVQAIAWAVVIALGGGLVALGVTTFLVAIGGHVARYWLARRVVPGLTLSRRAFDRSLVRSFAGLSVWYALAQLSGLVSERIDPIVVGLVVDVPAAGVYAVGQRLAQLAGKLAATPAQTLFPYSAELSARDDLDGLRASMITGTRLGLAIAGPTALAIGLLAGPALDVWVGHSFHEAAPVAVYLAGALAIAALAQPGFSVLQGMGVVRGPAAIYAGESALNLGLSIGLGLRSGAVGVAEATLLATAAVKLFVFLPYMCRQLHVPLRSFYYAVLRAHLPAAAAAGAAGCGLRSAGVHGLVPVLGAALAIAAVYLVVLFATGLHTDERRRLLAFVGRRPAAVSEAG